MKIRYYLRGLGLGILITSIFFLVSNSGSSQTMSDEMIKARAKELGMIENTVLAEIYSEEESTEESATDALTESVSEEESETDTAIDEEMIAAVEEEKSTIEENVDEEISDAEMESRSEVEDINEAVTEEHLDNVSQNAAPVSITVNRGDGSDTVSRRLYEAGLVEDANEYDRYLMANGYDKRIGAGEHIVPAGATWEEIAKILCN